MHQQEIIDSILNKINHTNHKIFNISLICNQETIINNLNKDIISGIREKNIINKSLNYLPLYQHLNTLKIDTSNLTANQVAEQIIKKIKLD